MAERFQTPPGVTQGDIGPRYVRKRLQDEVYVARYCKTGDRIRTRVQLATGVAAAVTTVTIKIGGRVQGMDGQLSGFSDAYLYTADGAGTDRFIRVPEGYVTHLIVESTTSGLSLGDVSVIVDLVEGEGSTPTAVDLLAAGWVSDLYLLGLNTVMMVV